MTAALSVRSLSVSYGSIAAVRDVDLVVNPGEIVGLVGPNGAGKTTTLGAIAGLLKPRSGSVEFNGRGVAGSPPDKMLRRGLALVPEHRRLFRGLTVRENLVVGGASARPKEREKRIQEACELFPMLAERSSVPAGHLSGGQAQQLAIARALMSDPQLLLMDEPSLGLAPLIVEEIFRIIRDLNAEGVSIFLVEQNVHQALKVAHHFYLLEQGRVTFGGSPGDLEEDEVIQRAYLGSAEQT